MIADDGVGSHARFDDRGKGTMGMNLMQGLAKDIDGEFSIYSDNGTTVKIGFAYHLGLPGIATA